MRRDKSELARVAGLRELDTPQLEDVDRRRAQLWTLSLVVVLTLPLAIMLIDTELAPERYSELANMRVVRWVLGAFLVVILGYVVERETALRRLSRMLVEERVLTANLVGRVEELDLLLTATRAMNSSLDLAMVLDVILQSACELVDAADGSIQLVIPGGEELEVVAVRGDSTARAGQRQAFSEGLAGKAVSRREPLLIQGGQPGSRVRRSVGSALVVPLEIRGELVGVLNLASQKDAVFSEFHLRSVSVFAEAAAGAINNAHVHELSEERVEALTELDRMKSEFLATVTHELRTPLTVMIGIASTLVQETPRLGTEDVAQLAEMVRTQGWRLDRLVGQLLEAAVSDRQELTLEPRRTDVVAVVRNAVTALRRTAAGRDHETHLHLPDDPVDAVVDPDALARMVTNLVTNAFRHTPAGTDVEVELATTDEQLVLRVSDDGPGIPEEEAARVFEKFVRGAQSADGEGLGLGLHLVRALAVAHGGDVSLTSSSSGGCRFEVRLPMGSDHPADPPEAYQSSLGAPEPSRPS